MNICDIIIPTHNQRSTLDRVVSALITQYIPPSWRPRLIISYDGIGHTSVNAKSLPPPWLPLVQVEGPAAGSAAARNRALASTKISSPSHLVLFLGDDIILRPGALAAHLTFHQRHHSSRIGAVGFIAWHPSLNPTPLMEWMIHGGPQNNFDDLLAGQDADPAQFFYGSFVSIKRNILQDLEFPHYAHYGWEDLDLGQQLAARGLRLYPLEHAQAYHHHQYSPADIIRRARVVGRSLVSYQDRYPTRTLLAVSSRTWWRLLLYRYTGLGALFRFLLKTIGPRFALPRLFLLVTAAEHWVGVYQTDRGKVKKQNKAQQR